MSPILFSLLCRLLTCRWTSLRCWMPLQTTRRDGKDTFRLLQIERRPRKVASCCVTDCITDYGLQQRLDCDTILYLHVLVQEHVHANVHVHCRLHADAQTCTVQICKLYTVYMGITADEKFRHSCFGGFGVQGLGFQCLMLGLERLGSRV